MTCLQLCVLFNFQICGTFSPVFMKNFFKVEANSVQMHCQCFYSAVTANSKLDYSIHNVEMPSNMSYLMFISAPCQNRRIFGNYNPCQNRRTFGNKISFRCQVDFNQIWRFVSIMKKKPRANLTVACHRHPTE